MRAVVILKHQRALKLPAPRRRHAPAERTDAASSRAAPAAVSATTASPTTASRRTTTAAKFAAG